MQPDEMTAAARGGGTRPRGLRERWTRLSQWRNWRLPTKLAAVILVPVVFAVGLGVAQIGNQIDRAELYEQENQALVVRDAVQPVITGIQDERGRAAAFQSGLVSNTSALDAQTATVQQATAKLDRTMGNPARFGPVVAQRYAATQDALGRLPRLRAQVHSSSIEPTETIRSYTDAVSTVTGLAHALINNVDNTDLASTAAALHEFGAVEEEARLQQPLGVLALLGKQSSQEATEQLRGSQARGQGKLDEYFGTTTQNQQRLFANTVAGPAVRARKNALQEMLRQPGSQPLSVTNWQNDSRQVVQKMSTVREGLTDQLRSKAARLQDEASDQAGLDSVLLLSGLLVAGAVMVVMTRHLLRSLTTLRRSALSISERRLPEAVSQVREGDRVDTAVEPLPVDTTEEVGQVARAFDGVHRQAVHLAVEQAGLRRGFSESFINVSRRSQSLLERQLRLFEQLEYNEEDPDQLSTLFQLDHLATRMRRNNENLMVLSGRDLTRRYTEPVLVSDVLRAAVSEIEHYPRVTVQPPPEVHLVGYAGSDLVRLIAELLDNAANFSSPDTVVTVTSYRSGDGAVSVEIVDRGIGMGVGELSQANQRLAHVAETDLATSRRMGLFVVGRLASRHGIEASLQHGPGGEGVRAIIVLHRELVDAGDRATGPPPPPGQPPARHGSARPELPVDAALGSHRQHTLPADLPQRVQGGDGSGVNGNPSPPTRPAYGAADDLGAPSAAPDEATASGIPWPVADVSPVDESPATHAWPGDPDTRLDSGPVGQEREPFSWPGSDRPPVQNAPPPQPHSAAESTVGRQPIEDTGPIPPVPGLDPAADGSPRSGSPAGEDIAKPDSPRGLFEPPAGQPAPEFQESVVDDGPAVADHTASAPADPTEDRYDPSTGDSTEADASIGERAESPIFNELASAWFQPTPEDAQHQERARQLQGEEPEAPLPPPEVSPEPTGASWAFDADEARRAAEAATTAQPDEYTTAGLPRRKPRAQLAPGSIGPRHSAEEPAPPQPPAAAAPPGPEPRDPGTVRDRLAGFQQGVRSTGTNLPPASAGPADPSPASSSRPAPPDSTDGSQHSPWSTSGAAAPSSVGSGSENGSDADYTAAGLPRRTPRKQPAPDGAAAPGTPSTSADTPLIDPGGSGAHQRHPEELQGRLSSFQHGARQGRHSAVSDPGETPEGQE